MSFFKKSLLISLNLKPLKKLTIRIGLPVFILLFLSNFSIVTSVLRMLGTLPPQPLPQVIVGSDGKAVTTVPIELPPGTKGIIPQLSLSYNSAGGEGFLGWGWQLNGIHSIERDPSFGVNYGGSDSFRSSLGGQLVDVSGNRTVFHSRVENLFQFIPQGTCGDGPCTWIVTDKNGITYTFGGSADSQIIAIGQTNSIRVWALNKVADSFGNGYTISYLPPDGTGAYYPNTISYLNRSIQFNYETRPDGANFSSTNVTDYSQSAPVKVLNRLNNLIINVNGSLLREYEFGYSQGPVSNRSLLTIIRRDGSNQFGSESFDDLEFTYTSIQQSGGFSVSGMQQVTDLTNQQRPNGSVFTASPLATVTGSEAQNNFPPNSQSTTTRYNSLMQYLVNEPVPDRFSCNIGTGACICAALPVCYGYNPSIFNDLAFTCQAFGGWDGINGCAYGIPTALTSWLPADLDGDGVLDFIALTGTDGAVTLYARTINASGGTTFPASTTLPIFYNTYYSLSDINGDGKSDFVYESGGTLWAIYSRGASFSSPVQFSNVSLKAADRNMTVFDPYEYIFDSSIPGNKQWLSDFGASDYFADMNSDGLADFIHYDGFNFRIYINQKGSFANPIVIAANVSPYLNQFTDMNNDGVAEYVSLSTTSTNPNVILLQQQLAQLNAQQNQIQTDYNNQLAVLQTLLKATSASNLPTSASLLTLQNYYTNNSFPSDATLVQTLVTQITGGTAATATQSSTLTTDLQTAFATLLGPVLVNINSVNAQLASAQAASSQISTINVTYFNLKNSSSTGYSYPIASYDPLRSFLIDINADGKPDLVTIDVITAFTYLNTGFGFTSGRSVNLNSGTRTSLVQFNFADVNADGFTDLVLYNKDSKNIETYLSNGYGFDSLSSKYSFGNLPTFQSAPDQYGNVASDIYQITVTDVDRDSNPDVVIGFLASDLSYGGIQWVRSVKRTVPEDAILTVQNGTGAQVGVSYGTVATQTNGYIAGTGNYPFFPNTSPDFVVTSLTTDLTNGAAKTSLYTYTNSKFYMGLPGIGRGLGFATITETDLATSFYTVTNYFQSSYRLAGQPNIQSSYNASGNLLSQTTISNFYYPNPFGTEIAVPQSIVKNSYRNGMLLTSDNKTITYDIYGKPLTTTDYLGSHTIYTQIIYADDLNAWRMGRIQESIKTVDGSLVEDNLITYNGDFVSSMTKYPGTNVAQTTSFGGPDAFGNPSSVTDALGATTQIAYDTTTNSLPVTKTNALGQVTSYTYDYSLGLNLTETDPNGGTTSKLYDGYGRLLSVMYPGESSWNEYYTYNNTGRFNLTNLSQNESVSKQVRDNISGNSTITNSYSDPMGNEIRSEVNTSVSSVFIVTTKTYDYTTGNLIQKSNAYLSNDSPAYTTYKYADPDNLLTEIDEPDLSGTIVSTISYSGLTTNTNIAYPDGSSKTKSETKNELDQIISTVDNGKTVSYTYDPHGGQKTITDPSGLVTTNSYDIAGRKTSYSDSNSGTVSYTYDLMGRVLSQTDARGSSVTNQYDQLGRLISQTTNGGEIASTFTYDDTSVSNAIGRLTKVTDSSGSSTFGYDIKGNVIRKTKSIDDLTFVVLKSYDSLGRVLTLTYPDGSKTHNSYSVNNYLNTITFDSADGTSTGYTVISYNGPTIDSTTGYPTVTRSTGNGVVQNIGFDRIKLRVLELKTTLPNSTINGDIVYSYDGSGNITTLQDKVTTARTQTFTYDSWNRVISATGIYGSQTYAYTSNGNITQKDGYTLTYGNSSHANAVTSAYSQNTGTLNYTYDASGNMISRNGDTLIYDSKSRMVEYDPNGGGSILYTYDYAGNRIKANNQNTATVTYFLEDLYEIVRAPSASEQHTLYIKGLEGDLVSQLTRNNAVLITSNSLENQKEPILASAFMQPFCKDVAGDCGEYWKNRITGPSSKFFTHSSFFMKGIPSDLFASYYYVFLLLLLYLLYPYLKKGNEFLERAKIVGLGSPALLLSLVVAFSVQGCNGFLGGGGSGQAPWILALGSSTNPNTPTFNSPVASGVGAVSGGTPVAGMYFYHPDHLGSTTLITDGNGNPAPGPGQSGVSHVSYMPYGQIDRNDSFGPNIFRYQYTGQINDSDTGLYFYKSRYYDSVLGRFVQPDDRINPGINGTNRFMYVSGNPIGSNDPTGHVDWSQAIHMLDQIIGHMMWKSFNHGAGWNKFASQIGKFNLSKATFITKGKLFWDPKNSWFGARRLARWYNLNDWWNTGKARDAYFRKTANATIDFTLTLYGMGIIGDCNDQFGPQVCGQIMVYFWNQYGIDKDKFFNKGGWNRVFKWDIHFRFKDGQAQDSADNAHAACSTTKSFTEFYWGSQDFEGAGYPNPQDGSIRHTEGNITFIENTFLLYKNCSGNSGGDG